MDAPPVSVDKKDDIQYHNVQFRCSNQLALLTTDSVQTGSYTRSVYVVASQEQGDGADASTATNTMTLIEGLKFHLYIAVPDTLSVHRLYEEMMLLYGQASYGRRAQDQLRKEVSERRQEVSKLRADIATGENDNIDAVDKKKEKLADKLVEKSIKEAKLITMQNQAQLYYRYRRLLFGGESTTEDEDDDTSGEMVPDMQPSREKEEWIKKEMGGNSAKGLFIIKHYQVCDIAKNARLAEKTLRGYRVYRFTFDNHSVLQYFIRQFSAQPLVIGGTYDPEQRKRVGGEQYQILVLDSPCSGTPGGGIQDPSLYVAPKGDTHHVQCVLRQCQTFTQQDYVYQWRWRSTAGGETSRLTTLKNGCLEPAFPYGTDNMNTVVGGGANIIKLLNQNAVPVVLDRETPSKTSYRPAQCTLTFNLKDLFVDSGTPHATTALVSLDSKESTISLSLSGASVKKKRGADEADMGDHGGGVSETKKVALDSALLSPAAMTKMTHLPGQKKRPVQGKLSFVTSGQ